ncbi:MAG: hypothetical protein LC128_10235 [Chitinophagales bacterium]|nr:hypothetical protein [Chitinophagales bacterium]
MPVTDLEYDFPGVFFKTDKIKTEETLAISLPRNMNSNKGIVVDRRCPIGLYLILYKKVVKANTAKWIASFDPKHHSALKIISTNTPDAFISKSAFEVYYPVPQKNIVIAFIGPPDCGKSVFVYALFKQLLQKNSAYTNKNIFIIKGCPDGEGLWASSLSQQYIKEIRYKNKFTDKFAKNVIEEINNTKKSKTIIFVDCGGKKSKPNKHILQMHHR